MSTHPSSSRNLLRRRWIAALVLTTLTGVIGAPTAHAAEGDLLWAARLGGTGSDNGSAIAVDAAGNVYTAGSFSGTADFDPGAGTQNLVSIGSFDVFVSKLDASGNFLWVN